MINLDIAENEAFLNKLNEKKKNYEQNIKELKSIKEELVGENITNIKSKITNMNENINNLTEKQNEFSTKIKKVNDFYNSLNKNNKIIDSLQQKMII